MQKWWMRRSEPPPIKSNLTFNQLAEQLQKMQQFGNTEWLEDYTLIDVALFAPTEI